MFNKSKSFRLAKMTAQPIQMINVELIDLKKKMTFISWCFLWDFDLNYSMTAVREYSQRLLLQLSHNVAYYLLSRLGPYAQLQEAIKFFWEHSKKSWLLSKSISIDYTSQWLLLKTLVNNFSPKQHPKKRNGRLLSEAKVVDGPKHQKHGS